MKNAVLVSVCWEKLCENKEGNNGVLSGHSLPLSGLVSLCLSHSEVLIPQLSEHF